MEADKQLLDIARKLEWYGFRMHDARDHENVPITLSPTADGIVVVQVSL